MDEETVIRKMVRGWLQREISGPAVQAAKRNLVAEFSGAEPRVFFQRAFLVPAFCMAVLFLVFLNIQLQPLVPAPVENPVLVKRVSSQVGTTMVYQKISQNVPVTIVWVFIPEVK